MKQATMAMEGDVSYLGITALVTVRVSICLLIHCSVFRVSCSVFCFVLFFCRPFLSSPFVSGSSNLLGPCAFFWVKSLKGGRKLESTNHQRPYTPSLAFENLSRLWMWADLLTGRFGLQKGLRLEWFLRLSYFPQGIGDYVLINFMSFTLLRRFE